MDRQNDAGAIRGPLLSDLMHHFQEQLMFTLIYPAISLHHRRINFDRFLAQYSS